jgi:hypothetical protein
MTIQTSSQTAPVQVAVNVSNFARAESDTYFASIVEAAGGVNQWLHYRKPPSVDDQKIIRLNLDTLYSSAVVDISAGARLTMPQTNGRYQTAMIVNQDHYVNRVFDRPGLHELSVDEFDTPWVLVSVRTLVDSADADDLGHVAALQDGLRIESGSARPFIRPPYDDESLNRTRALLLDLARDYPNTERAFGPRDEVDTIQHLLSTAVGWGGLPRSQAVYQVINPNLPVGHYMLKLHEVPVRAFWSVTVYNRQGFFEKNDMGRYNVNSVTAKRDSDGGITVHLGGDPALPNQIPLSEGWNYAVRLYQPEAPILDGEWAFPKAVPAS